MYRLATIGEKLTGTKKQTSVRNCK